MKMFLHRLMIMYVSHTLLSPVMTFGQTLQRGPQVMTFFSDADDTEQPYGLYIPPNYDASKKYPLVMMLHGAGSNHRLALRRVFGKSNDEGETDVEASRVFPKWEDVDFVVASPYARGTAGYQGIPEKDVYDVLADVKRRLNIDENRIYLTGLSMGGGGALWLGLTRPDIWAAIAPVCPALPAGTGKLAANALNFPVHFFHGDADPVVPVDGTRKLVSDMQNIGVEVSYKEFVDVKHDSWVSAYDAGFIFEWFKPIERVPFPNQVRFVSSMHKYNKAYWIELDTFVNGELAEVNARFDKANTISITTKNLPGLTLRLNGHPMFKAAEEVTLLIDKLRVSVRTTDEIHLIKTDVGWAEKMGASEQVGLIKKGGAEGPLFDAFSERHIYVYGTRDNPDAAELKRRIDLATEAANWSVYRGEFLGRMMFFPRVVSDKALRASDRAECNLILFGTRESNLVLAENANKLPVSLVKENTGYGLFYIFPLGKRYVAVSSGLPWWKGLKEEGRPFVPLAFRKIPEFKDIVLFKDSVENIIVNDYFSREWKTTDGLKKKLMATGVITMQE